MEVWRASREAMGMEWAMEACRLWEAAFPKVEELSLEGRAAAFLAKERVCRKMVEDSEIFHLVTKDGRLNSVAWSFIREMAFEGKEKSVRVLGLAGVCSATDVRGQGFGLAVVRDAFSRLGPEDLSWCLFQTGVPQFYEKLGACLVGNSFVNSFSAKDVLANPWWDKHVMVFVDGEDWPDGRVDTLGEAY